MTGSRPSDNEAERAIRVLVRWMGDCPDREGLVATPGRVLEAYKKVFAGYDEVVSDLRGSVLPSENFSDMIILKGLGFMSHCEHHLTPIKGKVSIAYVPDKLILGVGKIVRIVGLFAKRLQLQERLAVQISDFLHELLHPLGVATLIEAMHGCVICADGHSRDEFVLHTSSMLGVFRDDQNMRKEFFDRLKFML